MQKSCPIVGLFFNSTCNGCQASLNGGLGVLNFFDKRWGRADLVTT